MFPLTTNTSDHGARIEAVAHNLCSCHPGASGADEESDFDPRDAPLFTPLHIAVCNGRLGTAKLLLSRGAGIQGHLPSLQLHRGNTGTVLHTAAHNNDGATVCFLLENGLVNVDSRDSQGYTALHLACLHHGDLHAFKALLLHGANPNAAALNDRTPFAVACSNGYFNACLALMDGVPVIEYGPGFGDMGDESPCHVAVKPMRHFSALQPPTDPDIWENDRQAFLRRLLDESPVRVDVDTTTTYNQTPLHLAACVLSPASVVQCLLDNDANVNYEDDSRRSPLFVLLEKGDLHLIAPIVGLLLRHGARLDVTCRHGLDALHAALKIARDTNSYAIINFIFQHASAANFRDGYLSKGGYLSLVVNAAHKAGRYEECRVLMRHGARLDLDKSKLKRLLQNSLEEYPACVLQIQFYLEMFPSLVTASDVMRSALRGGLHQSSTEVFSLLLARPDFRLDPQTKGTTTLLHLACRMPAPLDIIQRLLNMGSDPNLFNWRCELPLSTAIYNGRLDIAELLLKHGADPFVRPSPKEWDRYVAWASKPRPRTSHGASWSQPISYAVEQYETPFEITLQTDTTFPKGDTTNGVSAETFLSLILEHRGLPALPAEPSVPSYIHNALFNDVALGILLRKGADPNSGEHCTNPPLMRAVDFKHDSSNNCDRAYRAVRRLLQHGANVCQKNEEGRCFVDVIKEAHQARAENPDELAEFKDKNGEFALQCQLCLVCRLTVDVVSGEDGIKSLTREELFANGAAEDWTRRRDAWVELQEKKERRADRKRLREKEREEQRENRRCSTRLLHATHEKRQKKS